jgi:hypothetical protein
MRQTECQDVLQVHKNKFCLNFAPDIIKMFCKILRRAAVRRHAFAGKIAWDVVKYSHGKIAGAEQSRQAAA